MSNYQQALTIHTIKKTESVTERLADLRGLVAEAQLSIDRHGATRNQAIADFDALCKIPEAAEGSAGFQLRTLIEKATEGLTIARGMLADYEVQEGRLRVSGRKLLRGSRGSSLGDQEGQVWQRDTSSSVVLTAGELRLRPCPFARLDP